MCDIDIAVTLDEYKVVEWSELYYRKQLGHDVKEVGSAGYFTDEHTGAQYLWVQYYDYTTDERVRVRRYRVKKDDAIRLGS